MKTAPASESTAPTSKSGVATKSSSKSAAPAQGKPSWWSRFRKGLAGKTRRKPKDGPNIYPLY